MKQSIIWRTAAKREADEASARYEGHRPGLGIEFVNEVDRIISEITDDPKRFPIARGDARQAPLMRFPYCIFYRVRPNRLIITAVFHTSRDPAIWQQRF